MRGPVNLVRRLSSLKMPEVTYSIHKDNCDGFPWQRVVPSQIFYEKNSQIQPIFLLFMFDSESRLYVSSVKHILCVRRHATGVSFSSLKRIHLQRDWWRIQGKLIRARMKLRACLRQFTERTSFPVLGTSADHALPKPNQSEYFFEQQLNCWYPNYGPSNI